VLAEVGYNNRIYGSFIVIEITACVKSCGCISFHAVDCKTTMHAVIESYFYQCNTIILIILISSPPLVLQPPWALASAFQFRDYFTDGRTPCTSDQLVARPLPKHRTTQTQNKHIHTPNIHVLCGIRTQRSQLPSERRQFMP
jgi:hypothetical protein